MLRVSGATNTPPRRRDTMATIDTVTVNAAEFFNLEILGHADNDLRVFVLFRDDVGTFAVEDWCMDLEVPADRIGQHDVSDLYAKWWNDSLFADDAELEAVKRELGFTTGPTLDQVAALRCEAIAAGDLELAAACHLAIEDDDDAAWEAVTIALEYAAGQI